MSVHLLPCPSCSRHVRASESTCPFCRSALDVAGARAPRGPTSRLGRAATFAFGAAVATSLSVAGCAESEERAPDGGGEVDSGGPVPAYGAPAVDAGPGEDAGTAADAGPDDAGGVGPLYGGPAPVDGGGGPAPAYGAPPES